MITTSKSIFCSSLFLFASLTAFSQKQFFKSQQTFSTSQLENFYSSVIIDNDLLLFIANDYKLYAYNKLTGEPQWTNTIGYKTKVQCFVKDNIIYSPYSSESKESFTAQFDRQTGKLIKQLPIGPLLTNPEMHNEILFGTAIYDGGCLFAYDTKTDSLLWWKFVAHGVGTQPYFLSNYIRANAEANNWFSINYNGQLTDTICKEKANMYVNDIPCIQKFGALTHDGFELDAKFSAKLFENDEDAISTENTLIAKTHSFILHDNKLAIIGNKRKLSKLVNLSLLVADSIREDTWRLNRILQANEKEVVLVYNDQLIAYNYIQNKVEKLFDLSSWLPSQVLLDEDKLWLISKIDGLLYGLSIVGKE